MAIEDLMFQTIDVERPTILKDAFGGLTPNLNTAVYTDVPAHIQPSKNTDKILYSQRNIFITNTIYITQALTIQVGDFLLYGTRRFIVKGVRNQSELGICIAIDCEETI